MKIIDERETRNKNNDKKEQIGHLKFVTIGTLS